MKRMLTLGATLVVLLAYWGYPKVPVKFTTDWTWQSVYAAYLVAEAEGYYAEEGIAITIDRGYGSADAATKIAAGAYDFGVVDLGVLVEFNVKNPDNALKAVAIIYDFSPLSIITIRGRGIQTPLDLRGRTIAAPEGAAARRMFPVFASAVGLDPETVSWLTVTAALREPMLVEGRAHATAAFLDAVLSLQSLGVPPEQIVVFHFPEHGVDMYGLALVTRPEIIEKQPQVVRGVVRATIRGWLRTIEDKDLAIRVLKRRDPLIDERLELARLELAVERLIMTPWVAEYGFGGASSERLLSHIRAVVQALKLPGTPSVDDIFTDGFLPPLQERLPRN